MSWRNLLAFSALVWVASTGAVAAAPFDASIKSETRSPITQLAQRPQQLEQLDLSNAQQAQIRAIRDRYKGQTEQQRQTLRTAREQLKELMAGNASANEIRAQHNTVTSLQQQMADSHLEMMLEIREILTIEQREQLAQMTEERQNNRPERPRPTNRSGNGSVRR
ncbi:MAG: Spy/CpxP family protein refolding chaperone [Jaaginema sp. PMC 1079.18]|nr:Spy/CpxP family protein refolding chaperone [Jaaginema sp. PMC 1080.18]MEC4853975.1 Spy/CpxP family protein refolding chaperone [Jaaginema sp. PMC 1079.18]MEC4865070.1 Spy/CpxP family protein refolding chaperone [Jaaginema sp. PMC 1078.18]